MHYLSLPEQSIMDGALRRGLSMVGHVKLPHDQPFQPLPKGLGGPPAPRKDEAGPAPKEPPPRPLEPYPDYGCGC